MLRWWKTKQTLHWSQNSTTSNVTSWTRVAIISIFQLRTDKSNSEDSLFWHGAIYCGFFFWTCVFSLHLISCTGERGICQCARSRRMLMHKMWCNGVKLSHTVSYVVYWFSVRTHTDMHKTGPNPLLFHTRRGRKKGDVWMGVLVWVIRVCFSALSLNSPLAQCWKDWYWILADMFPPPSLRARDERTCCAECSNTAHTHTDTQFQLVVKQKTEKKVKKGQELRIWLKIKWEKCTK